MTKNQDTLYLNGIKGIACLIVFIMHFVQTFYPAVFNGTVFLPHLPNDLDAKIIQTPLMSLINGRLMVGVFMVISGMIITIQVMKNNDEKKLSEIIFKRYFRFTFVLFFFCLLIFVMKKLGLFFAPECVEITGARGTLGIYANDFSLQDCFKHAFFLIPFKKNTAFSLAFWCIKDMLIGSYISILLGIAAKNLNKYSLILFAVLYIMFAYNNFWFSTFVLGSIIGYVYIHKEEFYDPGKVKVYDAAGVILFIAGMVIGTYPWRIQPTNFYASLGALIPEGMDKAVFFEIFGGFMIVCGLSMSRIRFLFCTKPMLFLGKLSFSIYLLHVPVLYSLGCWMMIMLNKANADYILSTILIFAAVLTAVLAVSYVFNRYVETFCSKLMIKLWQVFSRKTDFTQEQG